MKKILSFSFVISIILILFTPQICKSAIISATNLSLYSLFPIIFPFIAITSCMSYFNLYEPLSKVFYPAFHSLFGVSISGCYVTIVGFTCGYPMGTKTATSLYNSGKITYNEYIYLTSFTNNIGIDFLIGYVHTAILSKTLHPLLLCLIAYIPSLLTGIIFKKESFSETCCRENVEFEPEGNFHLQFKQNPITDTSNNLFLSCSFFDYLRLYLLFNSKQNSG